MKLTDKMYTIYFPVAKKFWNQHASPSLASTPTPFTDKDKAIETANGCRKYYTDCYQKYPEYQHYADMKLKFSEIQLVEYTLTETKRETL